MTGIWVRVSDHGQLLTRESKQIIDTTEIRFEQSSTFKIKTRKRVKDDQTMQRSKSSHKVGAPHKSLAADSFINDDSAEKRKRREERVAEKHLERKKVVAAAVHHGSPLRNSSGAPSSPPRTPNGTVLQNVEHHTPVKKVPILANFEEWMKMATDNVFAGMINTDIEN